MKRAASLLTVVLLAHTSTAAQSVRFTAEDMLKVVTAAVQDLSEEGRRVAVPEPRPYANAEPTNYRYADPTYLAPLAVRWSSSTRRPANGSFRWATSFQTCGRRRSR